MSVLDLQLETSQGPAGYARLTPMVASFDQSPVYVTVLDEYLGKYLTENGHWHAQETWFGPYEIGADKSIVIGPEIVNHIEEYKVVNITAGGLVDVMSWPDTIAISPGAKAIGVAHADPASIIRHPDNALKGSVEIPSEPTPAPDPKRDPDPTITPEPSSNSWKSIVAMLALAGIVATAVYFYLDGETPPIIPKPEPVIILEPEPELTLLPVPVADPCAPHQLRAETNDFAALREIITSCGGAVDAGLALNLLDQAERTGDGRAVMDFGHLYNPDHSDPLLEDQLGVELSEDRATALAYYKRALESGVSEAQTHLDDLCETLKDSTSLIEQNAHRDNCTAP
ncbi:MAG: hypothetical protein ACJAZ1_000692 [Yoonia sp.]|jgi:hypothetical protein